MAHNTDSIRIKEASNLTIASGAVTATQMFHQLTAQADTTPLDDLDTITLGFSQLSDGANTYRPMLLLFANSGDTITVKNGTGNISLDADVTLTGDSILLLIYDGTNWKDFKTSATGGGGAPTDATYIVQTANGTLTNEQALGALATGIMYNTTTTGIVSIATAGTDYLSPTGTETVTNKTINPANNTIDGDVLDITYTPSNYTPATTPPEASDVDDLAAHLYGIDQGLGTIPTTAQLILTAGGGSSPTTNGAANGTIETTTNAVLVPTKDFDDTTDEYVQWAIVMPDNWDASTITASFYWSATAGTASASETVTWAIQGVAFADNDALDTAFGTAQTVSDTWLADEDLHVSSATSACTIAGSPTAGELVVFRVYRDASAGTMVGDAQLISVNITYGLA